MRIDELLERLKNIDGKILFAEGICISLKKIMSNEEIKNKINLCELTEINIFINKFESLQLDCLNSICDKYQ